MTKLHVFEGNFIEVNQGLGFSDAFSENNTRETYLAGIKVDLDRIPYFSLAGNVESFKSSLRNIEHLVKGANYSYTQANFFGGHFAGNVISMISVDRECQPKNAFILPYLGEKGELCGLYISYLDSTTFAISHIEGTTHIPEQRKTWVALSSSAEISHRNNEISNYNGNRHKPLEPSQFYSAMSKQIKSDSLKKLLVGVFNNDGSLNLDKLQSLEKRATSNQNFDNRDVKKILLDKLLAIGKELKSDAKLQAYIKYIEECAYNCTSEYFDIDFFEDTTFDSKLDRIQGKFDSLLGTHDGQNKAQREKLLFKTHALIEAIRYRLRSETTGDESKKELKAYYDLCASFCENALKQSDLGSELKQRRKELKEKLKNEITNQRENIIEELNKLIELDKASLLRDYKEAHLQKALQFRIAEYKTRINNLPEDAQVFLYTLTSIKQDIKDEYGKVLAEKLKKDTAQLTPNKPKKLGQKFIRRNPYSLGLAVFALLAVAAIALSMTGILPGLSVLALSIAWTTTVATGLVSAWKFRKDEIKYNDDTAAYKQELSSSKVKINNLDAKYKTEKKEAMELLAKPPEAEKPPLEEKKPRARAQSLSSGSTYGLFKPGVDQAEKKEEDDQKDNPPPRPQ